MKINEGYKLGVKVLRKYYLKLRCPEEKMKPLLKLGKLERMVLNNSDGELLKVTKLENHPIKYLDAYGLLHSYKELFEENIYFFESENKAPTIIDCGSNVGLSIIYFKMLFPESTVVGFEPDPTLFKLLEANLESFHFTNVEVRNEAVWNKNEYLRFETDPSLAGHVVTDTENKQTTNTIDVKATRLKELLENYNTIDFLKLDIEFSELEVIEDIAELLPRVRYLFVEFHNIGGKYLNELSRILSALESKGFRYYMKEAFNFLEHPFTYKAKEEIHEMWNSFNIAAINMK